MIFRRILDYFGLASYPAHPRILRRPDLAVGVNVHADGEWFPEIAETGFNTVLMDWWPDAEDALPFGDFFNFAKKNGLKVFITGFPKDSGPIAEQARELFDRHGPDLDFVAVRNEPDLAKFYGGTIEDLANDIRTVARLRDELAPHVKIAAPCFSSLGSSCRPGWRDKEAVIRRLTELLT